MTVQINKRAEPHIGRRRRRRRRRRRSRPCSFRGSVFYILSGSNDWSRSRPANAIQSRGMPPVYLSFHALFIIVRCFYRDPRWIARQFRRKKKREAAPSLVSFSFFLRKFSKKGFGKFIWSFFFKEEKDKTRREVELSSFFSFFSFLWNWDIFEDFPKRGSLFEDFWSRIFVVILWKKK